MQRRRPASRTEELFFQTAHLFGPFCGLAAARFIGYVPTAISLWTVSRKDGDPATMLTPLVDRNTPIPAKSTRTFTTQGDNQMAVYIEVFEGDDFTPRHISGTATSHPWHSSQLPNNHLGGIVIDGLAPVPCGQLQIDVTISIDVDGVLNLVVCEKVNGKTIRATCADGKNVIKQADNCFYESFSQSVLAFASFLTAASSKIEDEVSYLDDDADGDEISHLNDDSDGESDSAQPFKFFTNVEAALFTARKVCYLPKLYPSSECSSGRSCI